MPASLDVKAETPADVSRLGLGTSQFGNLGRETTEEESAEVVQAAWDAGVRMFDTAPHYGLGLSERRLGRALARYPRDEYLVSTKVGRLLVPTPENSGRRDTEGFLVPADHARVWDFSRDGIRASVEASLERLGLDRIDIAYLHDPDDHWAAASSTGLGALLELRDEGVVGAVGAGMNQSPMLTEFVVHGDVDVVMVAGRYTLLEQGAADDLLPAAASRGVRVIAAGVFNSGVLSQTSVSADATYDYGRAPDRVISRARRLAAICRDHGVALPAAAIQFPLMRPEIDAVVVGARTAGQVRENVAHLRAPIPPEYWDDLAREGLIPS